MGRVWKKIPRSGMQSNKFHFFRTKIGESWSWNDFVLCKAFSIQNFKLPTKCKHNQGLVRSAISIFYSKQKLAAVCKNNKTDATRMRFAEGTGKGGDSHQPSPTLEGSPECFWKKVNIFPWAHILGGGLETKLSPLLTEALFVPTTMLRLFQSFSSI